MMLNNRQELSVEIEQVMIQYKVTMMEAIVHICEQNNVEIETVAALVKQSPKLKEVLRKEAADLKMLNT